MKYPNIPSALIAVTHNEDPWNTWIVWNGVRWWKRQWNFRAYSINDEDYYPASVSELHLMTQSYQKELVRDLELPIYKSELWFQVTAVKFCLVLYEFSHFCDRNKDLIPFWKIIWCTVMISVVWFSHLTAGTIHSNESCPLVPQSQVKKLSYLQFQLVMLFIWNKFITIWNTDWDVLTMINITNLWKFEGCCSLTVR